MFPLDCHSLQQGQVAKDDHEEDLAASISVKCRRLVYDIPAVQAFFDVHTLLADAVTGLAEDAWVVS